ncbi:hypothetical protein [Phenylobacterium sp.]|jgi:hypothetical protein|uniref:hypothetical protein n=1 Tax=Phenylobacterium sp. TaxID=1871053 RepID=UPI002F429FBF
MFQADAPPAQAATPAAAAEVVVARSDHTAVAADLDLPLTITKAGRREEMVVRRAVFVTAQVIQVRAANAAADGTSDAKSDSGADRYRWKLAGYLQRQYCVRSLAGVFACTTPETEALPDKAEGEGPVTAVAGDYPLAITAERDLSDSLHMRAEALFAADRAAAVDPLLKAAGVKVAPSVPPRPGHR